MLEEATRRKIASYVVMMVLFFCKTSESLLQPSVRIYVYQQVCRGEGVSLAVCESQQQNGGLQSNSSRLCMTSQQESVVQHKASKYLLAYRILVNLPAVFFSVFAGSWSDRVGRKYPMMLPPFGAVFAVVCYYASSATEDSTNLGWVMVGAAVYGLFGKSTVMSIACSSYVADISSLEDRTKLLARLLAMNFFGVVVGSLLTSIFQSFESIYYMLILVLVINLGLELVIMLFVHESVEAAFSDSLFQLVCPCINTTTKSLAVQESIGFLIRRRPQQLLLLFLFASLCINQTCKQGEHDVLLLLSKHDPFNWPGQYYGYYLSVYYACMGLNLVLILPLMMHCMNIRDSVLVMIGLSMKIFRLVIISVANTTLWLFSSAVLGCFAGFIVSSIKSATSKLVEESEIGQTFSLLSCAESIANLVGPTLFSPIYAATVDVFPGMVLSLDAGVQVVLLCCFLRIYLIESDREVCEKGGDNSKVPSIADVKVSQEHINSVTLEADQRRLTSPEDSDGNTTDKINKCDISTSDVNRSDVSTSDVSSSDVRKSDVSKSDFTKTDVNNCGNSKVDAGPGLNHEATATHKEEADVSTVDVRRERSNSSDVDHD